MIGRSSIRQEIMKPNIKKKKKKKSKGRKKWLKNL
jgi:hypothetical protein